MKKLYLSIYRLLGFSSLLGLSVTIACFFFLMLFFFANDSWIAPTILSRTSDRMLTFANAYQQALQNVETLRGKKQTAELEYSSALSTHRDYASLTTELRNGRRTLAGLRRQTRSDLRESTELSRQLDRNRKQIDRSLKAGLITNEEAAQELAAGQSFHNALTDRRVSITSASASGESLADAGRRRN